MIKCILLECPSLSISNGVMNCSLGDDGALSSGDTCSFTCDTGYELTGSNARTCQSDGSWSGSAAVCSRGQLVTLLVICFIICLIHAINSSNSYIWNNTLIILDGLFIY